MPLEPTHPLEPALHRELRDGLNRELRNRNFFVWIDVRPTGTRSSFVDLARIVREAEAWLTDLDPDAQVGNERFRERVWSDPAADVRLKAIPKKPSARHERSREIVGNPEPALAGWA